MGDYTDYILVSGDIIGRALALAIPFILLVGLIFMVLNSVLKVVIK